jgi:membrane-associated protease RseP (regulator of RpoE activity)
LICLVIGRDIREAIPLSLGLWSVLIAHEIGHLIIAKSHNVRLSLPYFLPTWQIGSFGAITRFESLLPNRIVLFDIAFAGLLWEVWFL